MAITHSSITVAGFLAGINRWPFSTRWMLVLPLSLMIHVAGLWLLSGIGSVEYGKAGEARAAGQDSPVMTVAFVANEAPVLSKISPKIETESLATVEEMRAITQQDIESSKQSSISDSRRDYFPPGRLTRLPFPLTDIDLNVSEIDDVAFEGVIELTLWVEADGTVAHVETTSDHDGARQYADRVAARFERALFSPGEIDGKAVRSKVQITVVSEPLAPPASTT